MKERKLYYLLYLFIAATFVFINVGCSEDEDPVTPPVTVNETEVLVKYLETAGFDYINSSTSIITTATDVNALVADPTVTILDIRTGTDYALGHIQGSVNVAVADLITYYKNNNLSSKSKVILTCYTGQTAAFATALLRFAGYTNVYDLKWGMCSWSDSSKWYSAIQEGLNNPITLQTTPNSKNAAGDLPTFTSTGETEGSKILEKRLQILATEGFGAASVDKSVVFPGNLSNYYIVNYWPEAEYNTPGHVEGSIQYNPGSAFKLANELKTLPKDKTILIYCYTGQTSAQVAAYLRLLGYDAKSLLYGMNKLNYNVMTKNQYKTSECKRYQIVTGG
ncbi:MAG: rhodanese-like domain-containing protein [Ignavibacteriaceae bacterium]